MSNVHVTSCLLELLGAYFMENKSGLLWKAEAGGQLSFHKIVLVHLYIYLSSSLFNSGHLKQQKIREKISQEKGEKQT